MYIDLFVFKFFKEVKDFWLCEMTMKRGYIYACYAGVFVYLLEGWDYYEVGVIDYMCIDIIWEVVLKYGFVLV